MSRGFNAGEKRRLWLAAAAVCALRLALQLAVRASHGGWTFLVSIVDASRAVEALYWSRHPSLTLKDGGLYWLPLPMLVEAALLRFWSGLLWVPFIVNSVISAAAAAGAFALGLELAGEAAGLAAGAAFAASATSLLLGVGAGADPLLQAGTLWGLFFWTRWDLSPKKGVLRLGGLCWLAAGLARFEAWPIALAAAAALWWKRGRAARPALVWAAAAPVMWIAYCYAVSGRPLAFVGETLRTYDRLPPSAMLASFASVLSDTLPVWLIALGALGAASAPMAVQAALAAALAVYVIPAPWFFTAIDFHPWEISALALPVASAWLATRLRSLKPKARGLAWAAVALAYAALQIDGWRGFERSLRRPWADSVLSIARLRAAGALASSDTVLLEKPVERPKAWVELVQLAYPPADAVKASDLDDRLRAGAFRLAVISSSQDKARASGLSRIASAGTLSFWTRPGDALAASVCDRSLWRGATPEAPCP